MSQTILDGRKIFVKEDTENHVLPPLQKANSLPAQFGGHQNNFNSGFGGKGGPQQGGGHFQGGGFQRQPHHYQYRGSFGVGAGNNFGAGHRGHYNEGNFERDQDPQRHRYRSQEDDSPHRNNRSGNFQHENHHHRRDYSPRFQDESKSPRQHNERIPEQREPREPREPRDYRDRRRFSRSRSPPIQQQYGQDQQRKNFYRGNDRSSSSTSQYYNTGPQVGRNYHAQGRTTASAAYERIQETEGGTMQNTEQNNGSKALEIEKPSSRSDIVGYQIWIKNLPESVDADQLKKAFKGYGAIIRSRVPQDRGGESLCYGYVEFEEKEAAQKAIKEMDRAKFNGQVVQVLKRF